MAGSLFLSTQLHRVLSFAAFSPPQRTFRRRHLAVIPSKASVPKLGSRRSSLSIHGMPASNAAGAGTSTNAGASSLAKLSGPFHHPNIPVWAKWILGTIFCVAVPLYSRFRSIEQGVTKTVEVTEEVAKVAKKVAEDVAQALPEDGSLKKLALEVEDIANVVIVDAEEAKSIMHKVEEITEEVEAMAGPIIEELGEHGKGGS